MKFSAFSLLTLGLTTGVFANPTKVIREPSLVQRDLTAITGVLSEVSSKVDALGSAINSYSGGDPSSVNSASDDLISTIKSGVSTVQASGDLSSTDALGLTSPVQDLTKKVEGVVDSLISKKADFVAAGAGPTVYRSLQDQYDASKSLSDSITSKVPEALQDIAASLSAGITNAIQKGLDAYKDAGSGPTTAPSGSSSTAAPTSTGASPTTSSAVETSAGSTPAPSSSAPIGSSTGVAPIGTGNVTPTSTSPPLFTGAATMNKMSYSLGGAVAFAALAIAV